MIKTEREPDDRNILQAAANKRPGVLPYYEHNIAPNTAQAIIGGDWSDLLHSQRVEDHEEFFRNFNPFFLKCGYDTVSFECCICSVMEGGTFGAHKPAVITDRKSFNNYPWENRIHKEGKPFVLHSCEAIFSVMDDLIAAGIDIKHSNENAICAYDEWIERYGSRIALFGGLDMDDLNRKTAQEVFDITLQTAKRFRNKANGFAFGTGNQIGSKTPPENVCAMLEALAIIRREEP